MNDSKPLVYVFRDIVQSVSDILLPELKERCSDIKCADLNYRFGSWIEFCNTMNDWSQSETLRTEKFPCIFLVEDFPIVNATSDFNTCNVDVFILMSTEAEYSSFERQELVFDPILEPIYSELMQAIADEGEHFRVLNPRTDMPHTKWNRKFLGKQSISIGNGGLKLNDYVDAIQIQNLKLSLNKNVT